MTHKKIAAHKRAYQAGVSLIELMISITIGVVILGAILAVFSATSSTGRQSEAATRMSEDGAIAMNYMVGYIRMAGYSLPRANMTESGGKGTADSNFFGTGVRGCDTGFSNPTVAATSSLTCNAAGATSTAAISIRFEGDKWNTSPSSNSPTDCLGQVVSPTTASEYAFDGGATSYSMVESRFFVRTGTSSGVRELVCGGNGGGTNFTVQPIMQYVESLNLTYGMAADQTSRLVNRYVTQATIDAETATLGLTVDESWKRVVSVKICMVVRSESPDQNGTGSYVDCSGNVVASGDKYLRRAFRSVVTLRNRGQFQQLAS